LRNEIRKDYLIDRWVIFAPRRVKRPSDFAVKRTRGEAKICTFCPGHENLTPPATLLYIQDGNRIVKSRDVGKRRPSNWSVRCIPNLYPALIRAGRKIRAPKPEGRFPHIRCKAIGSHEIIIESPQHEDHPHCANPNQIDLWLRAAMDRIRDLGRTNAAAFVTLFRNHGREAGASISHAHSQIITTPLIPTQILEEQNAMCNLHNKTGSCPLCRVRAAESRSDRKILDTTHFTVFAPWASIFPFEFWIVPKRDAKTIVGISDAETRDLAQTIHKSFSALARTLFDPPYNAAFHLAPSGENDDVFHWHIEVYPKLSIHAGFELGTRMYINTLMPETVAETLSSALND
jgi:UDPglucose--hexose-1-phosphate uridylyltransferase